MGSSANGRWLGFPGHALRSPGGKSPGSDPQGKGGHQRGGLEGPSPLPNHQPEVIQEQYQPQNVATQTVELLPAAGAEPGRGAVEGGHRHRGEQEIGDASTHQGQRVEVATKGLRATPPAEGDKCAEVREMSDREREPQGTPIPQEPPGHAAHPQLLEGPRSKGRGKEGRADLRSPADDPPEALLGSTTRGKGGEDEQDHERSGPTPDEATLEPCLASPQTRPSHKAPWQGHDTDGGGVAGPLEGRR